MLNNDLKISKKNTLVDVVEERLLTFFRENELKPGDSLPGEIELKDALGVGRSVLREALSRFRMVGLLEAKTGRGMVLREPELFNGLERVVNPLLLSRDTLLDLLGFRVVIELGAIDFVFQNVVEQDIHDLEAILANQVVYENNQFAPQSDFEFHVKLLEIANNSSIRQFQKIVMPLFQFGKENFQSFFECYSKYGEMPSFVTHNQLLDLLKNGRKEEYRIAMRKHLDMYFEILKPGNRI